MIGLEVTLSALRWINITGRDVSAEIEPVQLRDQTIHVGDHVLIDGAEQIITGIELVDDRAQRIANLALMLSDPHQRSTLTLPRNG
ncbi:hypothetical protein A5792_12510 [Mycolicibacterium peregrinum]|uniref:Uncharacterized protein n=1 Tax=Mycolicibacterium peregrinum TaxID=43304 RepID=A0A1A0RGJ0_MYCPR|nr:hypothetical protein [Mycolicibacterium peregrinum]OBB33213.1 hypothetical protein A5792_12510 [Mycolicibacterium peregrinum]